MANIKITDLTNYPTVLSSSSDVLAIVDVTNNITKKITVDNLFLNRASTGGGVGAGGGTVTSLSLIAPQGLLVNGAATATITTSGVFSLSYNQIAGFIPLSVLASNPQEASANTYLAGDSTWKPLPIPSGTVQSVGLAMPNVLQVTTPLVTTTGTLTANWDGLGGGKIPALNLGGTVPSGQPITNYYLRADGTWQPPIGPGIGTVSSLTVTVPQGLLINQQSSATNTSNTPFALTWDTNAQIPPSVLGSGTPSSATFLSGTGWVTPPTQNQQNTVIRMLGSLSATAIAGATSVTLTGQYSVLDIPILGTIYFATNASQAYVVASVTPGLLTTTVTLQSALRENHFIGANVYKFAEPNAFSDVLLGSNLSSFVANQQLTVQNLQTPSSWLSGLLLPTPSLGKVGQFYRVSNNDAIFLKTDTNTWTEQTPFENTIDGRSFGQITKVLGAKTVNSIGSGYAFSYQIAIQAINLNSNIVFTGFKYLTTTGNINTVTLTLTPPSIGWTVGNYADLALAMEIAINQLPSAIAVKITNDDAALLLNVLTDIPTVFTDPNPPTVASLTPTGLSPNSFISSMTIAGNISAAVPADVNWKFSPPFAGALSTFIESKLETSIGIDDYISVQIPLTGRSQPVSTDSSIATGWTKTSTASIDHTGDIRNLFAAGQYLAFSSTDFAGYPILALSLVSGNTRITFNVNLTINFPPFTTASTLYRITTQQSPVAGGNNTLLVWPTPSTSIFGLSYSNGIFTNTSSTRRLCFNLQISFAMSYYSYTTGPYPSALISEADIWFVINSTNPNTVTNRRGQDNWIVPNMGVTGRDTLLLSTSWTFNMAQGDTVMAVCWANANYFLAGTYGNASGAILEIIEV